MRLSLLLFCLVACMSASRSPESVSGSVEPAAPPPPAEAAPSPRGEGPARALSSPGARANKLAALSGKSGDAPASAAAPAVQRMVHYNGYLKLKVPNPTHTLQHASEIAERAGGHVEALEATRVTLRVPVARFRATFAELAKIGDVLARSLTAQDVTDQFAATDLRAKTLRASRDRLIALLAKATTPREKLALLREIQRLTEQVDQLELQLGTLASLAEMSRLTVEAMPHRIELEQAREEPIAAFRWIRDLSPFRRDVALAGDRLELGVPAGMVALGDDDPWACEGPDGAVIWVSSRDNLPLGSSAYWLEAVRARHEKEYESAEVSTVGTFQLVRFVDQSERAYRYLVAVRADGDELDIVEIYYPSAEHEKRYDAAVRAVLEGGAA